MSKNSIEKQRECLETNLETINTIVSAIIGTKVIFKIEEKTDWNNQTYFSLVDLKNRSKECGIMKTAFENVYINSLGIWYNEKEMLIDLHFTYKLFGGGQNSVPFCNIKIEDGLVSIID